jgi:hypothetical protein
MADAWEPAEEAALANQVISEVLGRASGRLADECVGNFPRDTFFVGNLRNDDPSDPGSARLNAELLGKLAPTACGLEIKVEAVGETIELEVSASWAVYYRVFPDRVQQLRYQGGIETNGAATDEAPTESEAGQIEAGADAVAVGTDVSTDSISITPDDGAESSAGEGGGRRRQRTEALLPKFTKIPCGASGQARLTFRDGSWEADASDFAGAVQAELDRASSVARSDETRIRADRNADETVPVPLEAASAEGSYSAFVRSKWAEPLPSWSIGVSLSAYRWLDDPREVEARLELNNTTPGRYTSNGKPSPNQEPFIFETELEVRLVNGRAKPFELLLVPKGFRSDRRLWARGLNVGVDFQPIEARYVTTSTPVFEQPRYVTKSMPEAAFHGLSENPISRLAKIEDDMVAYLSEWDDALVEYRMRADWTEEFEREFEADRALYRDEIARFSRGRDLMATDEDVRLAFQLTNQVFAMGPNPGWRIFQLVFIVSQIPGIANLKTGLDAEERRKVDIVYYPTGGGKTEAYLGTLVFHGFFDRLRGKTAGVTAWIRFPLRLLTLQQTQRLADVLSLADLVRKGHKDPRLSGPAADPFSIGYFVGEEGSPNEISDPSKLSERDAAKAAPNWAVANDERARQTWKRVAWCPSCRSRSVVVDFDPTQVLLTHRCTNTGCAFPNGVMPVYITDNEIFRYLPTVLVGTIDKLAALGYQRKLAMVFGRVQGRCVIHGYYFGNCTQRGCREKLTPGVVPGLSAPSLLVQDELHLLREGLGTFDSHYETFAQELARLFGSPQIKLIASSATIEAFERQVEHLYGRDRSDGRVFPGNGPRLGESFYANTLTHPQRIYVGILPHNKTLLNAVLEVLELYHRTSLELRALRPGANPYEGSVTPGTPDWKALLDLYSTSLTYFLAKRDLDSASNDISADVSPNMQARGLPSLTQFHLTSDASTDEVERTLAHLQSTGGDNDADAVLATNMVSHGVDVDRFNAMLFHGMPRQNSEYIQASSRVGRSHCGIVFVCMHPARERDQSHFQYFQKYHEFLGQLVEPVAINRWAAFAMDRTIPGLFMADILQVIATSGTENPNRFYLLDFLKQKIASGQITRATLADVLKRAYFGDAGDVDGEVDGKVQRLLDQVVSAPANSTFVSEVLIPKPLLSLREVDEQVDIELDNEATTWSRRG